MSRPERESKFAGPQHLPRKMKRRTNGYGRYHPAPVSFLHDIKKYKKINIRAPHIDVGTTIPTIDDLIQRIQQVMGPLDLSEEAIKVAKRIRGERA